MRKDREVNLFRRRFYIPPSKIRIKNYIRETPSAVFNPAVFLDEKKVFIFPRLIFDYYKYTSSIGVFKIDLDDLLNGKVDRIFETEILLWPSDITDFLGCEDPRIHLHDDTIYMLYTGKGYELGDTTESKRIDYLYLAKMNRNFEILEKRYFRVLKDDGELVIPLSNKDSAFIEIEGEKAVMLTRPMMERGNLFCYGAVADLENMILHDLRVIMKPEEWEYKVGWSTNAVKMRDGEYLVGWHAVLRRDLSYRSGFAIVNEKGELIAVSDYTLFPSNLNEEYGDRALVIFGDGLLLVEDEIVWIGGVGDYSIGIFIANLKDVLQNMRNV